MVPARFRTQEYIAKPVTTVGYSHPQKQMQRRKPESSGERNKNARSVRNESGDGFDCSGNTALWRARLIAVSSLGGLADFLCFRSL